MGGDTDCTCRGHTTRKSPRQSAPLSIRAPRSVATRLSGALTADQRSVPRVSTLARPSRIIWGQIVRNAGRFPIVAPCVRHEYRPAEPGVRSHVPWTRLRAHIDQWDCARKSPRQDPQVDTGSRNARPVGRVCVHSGEVACVV